MATSYPPNPSATGDHNPRLLAPPDTCPECVTRSQYAVRATYGYRAEMVAYEIEAGYCCHECGHRWCTSWAVTAL